MKKWLQEDDDFLIENYKKLDFDDLKSRLIDTRTDDAIRWRAKHFGLTDKKNDSWSDEEIELVLSDLPIGIISKKINRTPTAINKKRAIEKAKQNKTSDYSKLFDLSAIENGVPNININSKSSQYFALLSSLEPGQSFEYPAKEKELVRNQIYLIPEKKFQTKKWTEKTRRVWRIK